MTDDPKLYDVTVTCSRRMSESQLRFRDEHPKAYTPEEVAAVRKVLAEQVPPEGYPEVGSRWRCRNGKVVQTVTSEPLRFAGDVRYVEVEGRAGLGIVLDETWRERWTEVTDPPAGRLIETDDQWEEVERAEDRRRATEVPDDDPPDYEALTDKTFDEINEAQRRSYNAETMRTRPAPPVRPSVPFGPGLELVMAADLRVGDLLPLRGENASYAPDAETLDPSGSGVYLFGQPILPFTLVVVRVSGEDETP